MKLPNFFKKKKKSLYTIAFYNVENLFDHIQDTNILDTDFIPTSDRKWDQNRYEKKSNKIAKVIASIGTSDTHKHPPLIIGLAEVENKKVLKDLVNTEALSSLKYDFVHYNSPDERGIDTALLYRKNYVNITQSKSHELYIETPEGIRDFTRDILQVSCTLLQEQITFLVNHWPSRRDGSGLTEYKRLNAASKNKAILRALSKEQPNQRFIVMGDFNDDPHDNSIKSLIEFGLYNPMETLLTKSKGTTKYKGHWNLFDQVIISHSFLKYQKKKLNFKSASIYDPEFLKQRHGKYKGTPHRTFGGRNYTGGYSDHFPVYVTLEKLE